VERQRVWNPGDGEYHAAEEEQEFISSAGARPVVPLVSGGQLEGLVLLGPARGPERFTFEDYDLMKMIARQSALLLCNLRLTHELVEARELAAVARVSSFVIHDLKNLTCTLSLLMTNADTHIGNTEFQKDVLAAVRHTVEKMKQLIQKLKVLPGGGPAQRPSTDLRALCGEAVRDFAKARPHAFLVCRGEPVTGRVDPDEMRTVVVNILQNGLDAAGEAGRITVETGRQNNASLIRITDNGCGMTREFQEEQLFRPFRSTKKNGLGIGMYQVRQIVNSFGGMIGVASEPGRGTTFTILLPPGDPACPVTEGHDAERSAAAQKSQERSLAGGR
jgi:putative PEP-CTERM system histidine kinase